MIKNIVVCCDGAGNEHGKENTNVVRLYKLIVKPHKSPIATLNPDVPFDYHALAIDEKRSTFRPNLWDERGLHRKSPQFFIADLVDSRMGKAQNFPRRKNSQQHL
ncbi:MAG: DUF2235 domain-containing protein [Calditrichaeota bacterium]|nr:DUF2235 domain-containing protein [Calditrichota bacterium]